jgi:hypothetical protein
LVISSLQFWHLICSRIIVEFNVNFKAMKKHILILVMLLIAATSFAQPSRRTTNNARTSGNERRTERTDDKKKTEVRRANKRTQNKSTVTKQKVTRSRDARQGNKSSERPPRQQHSNTERERPAGDKPSERPPRREYSNTSRERPAGDRPGSPDIRNNERPGTPRERKPVQPERRENVIRQPEGRPEAVKQRPPQYHSSRKFVEPRPVRHHYRRPPRPREYRARRFPYRRPPGIHIYWSLDMRHTYLRLYPYVKTWRYPVGYRIPTISAYDALYYNDEVMSVYGKVYEVFYSAATDEYFLYFGAYYPYHDFTVVLPGWIARAYSSYPEGYFRREHVIVTGLITSYDGKPEMVVQSEGQLKVY